MSEADKEQLSDLERAMALFGDELEQQEAAAAGRSLRASLIHDERARRERMRQRRQAEQRRRDQLGLGTPPAEALDDWNAEQCGQFMELLERVHDERGTDGFALATTLPTPDKGRKIRGFLIGYAGEAPEDSGSVGNASALYLCEDGTLRTYREDRTTMRTPQLPLQGVPLGQDGEFVAIYPGHFADRTIPRRRHGVIKHGVPLPPGVESVGSAYKSGVAKYQTHQVHPFIRESLEQSLAATAHYVIEEGRARPMHDRFSPPAAS